MTRNQIGLNINPMAGILRFKSGGGKHDRAMAFDQGHQNIHANCGCPGDTDMSMLHKGARRLGQAKEMFMSDAADRPLKRATSREDVAKPYFTCLATHHLSSPEQPWLSTGDVWLRIRYNLSLH